MVAYFPLTVLTSLVLRGFTPQISSAYCLMVLSLENLPEDATFMIAMLCQWSESCEGKPNKSFLRCSFSDLHPVLNSRHSHNNRRGKGIQSFHIVLSRIVTKFRRFLPSLCQFVPYLLVESYPFSDDQNTRYP